MATNNSTICKIVHYNMSPKLPVDNQNHCTPCTVYTDMLGIKHNEL